MRVALAATLALATPANIACDVVLITDGEIYDVAKVVKEAARSGHRLFAIAIGAAPVEALARQLAERTGGGCEFVGPRGDAEAAILRTFKRLRATPRNLKTVQWPQTPAWSAPSPKAVFPGDTLHLMAGMPALPAGGLAIEVADAAGRGTFIHVLIADRLTDGDLLPRLAAARRIASLDAVAARELALKYQLATAYTSFVVVDVRADGEKATELPATVKVPHMLAAGWGASSSASLKLAASMPPGFARFEVLSDDLPVADRDATDDLGVHSRDLAWSPPRIESDEGSGLDGATRRLILLSLQLAFTKGLPLPTTLEELHDKHGLPEKAHDTLTKWCESDRSLSEADVVAVLLAVLADKEAPGALDATFLERLKGAVLGERRYRAIRRRLSRMVLP
jgi:hypothetical protein